MSSYVYVLELKRPPETPESSEKKKGSTIMIVQNGPKRSHDESKASEFINQLSIRVPPHMDMEGIEVGKFVNVTYSEQGVISRRNPDKHYRSTELVARSLKPASAWQLGQPEALYPTEK